MRVERQVGLPEPLSTWATLHQPPMVVVVVVLLLSSEEAWHRADAVLPARFEEPCRGRGRDD